MNTLHEQTSRLLRAVELQSNGREVDAVRLCLAALGENSLKYSVLLTMGVSCARLGAHGIAIACFQAALLERPGDTIASKNLSILGGLTDTAQSSSSSDCAHSAPTRSYCTYFDLNYAPRGLVMIKSLLQHDPYSEIYVLCLDAGVEKLLESFDKRVITIPISELCSSDPEFEASRTNRTTIEWYFTATSVLCNHIMHRSIKKRRPITYLDADLCFFNNPISLHNEAKECSVQIIEHNFPPELSSLIRYGRFNVGWITFFPDSEGLRLLADYRRDCIEWCHDRLEGARFADQKYLDYWPFLYERVCVSKVPGANIAPWNIANQSIAKVESKFLVTDGPLIFYHFHGVARNLDGSYATKGGIKFQGPLGDLYSEYFDKLAEAEQEIAAQSKINYRDIRYGASTAEINNEG